MSRCAPPFCFRLALLVALASLAIGGGARASGSAPAGLGRDRPAFDPMQFFNGRTHSWGILEDRSGRATKRVRTETWGRMVGGELRMEQDLYMGDSPRTHRSWQIRRLDAHHFEGRANDTVGWAGGQSEGNYFEWTFTLATKPGDPLFNVRMTQHMYLLPDGRTMINRDTIRKFGILLAEVTEEFRRDGAR